MTSDRWSDLKPRVMSAAVMLALGAWAIWAGGTVFLSLAVLVTGGMMWELARMTRGEGQDWSMPLGVLAGLALALSLWVMLTVNLVLGLVFLASPVVAGLITPRRESWVFAAYACLIMLTGVALITLRWQGVTLILWLVAVVIVSDTAGYFAGRILGGPKFWPKVSPKKTWSGTVAGWIGALAVGCGFFAAGLAPAATIWLSPLVAFAGQMGDIAESAIKRRAGVKDSSNLIPGHGGLLDRFDALATGALAAALAAALTAGQWPVGG